MASVKDEVRLPRRYYRYIHSLLEVLWLYDTGNTDIWRAFQTLATRMWKEDTKRFVRLFYPQLSPILFNSMPDFCKKVKTVFVYSLR